MIRLDVLSSFDVDGDLRILFTADYMEQRRKLRLWSSTLVGLNIIHTNVHIKRTGAMELLYHG